MPSKLNEKQNAQKLITYLNKVESLDLFIDEEYLKNRADNENPDVRVKSQKNPNYSLDIEVTHASDSTPIEVRTRTWEKFTDTLRAISKELCTPNAGFMFHINGSRVIRSADVRKDLALIKRDIKQFKKKLPSEQLLKIRGYSVITKISHSEGNLFLLHDKRVLASENYFDRIEFCLNRERSDLMKQNIRSKTGTILLITIDSALSDEVLYSNLKEEDVAHYCHFTHKYQDLFKDIYIYESTGFDRIIKLNELENRVYELLD